MLRQAQEHVHTYNALVRTHLQKPAEVLGAEHGGRRVGAVGAPAGMGSQGDHALQCPLQTGEPVEARSVRHPQALKQTRCQLALEGAR